MFTRHKPNELLDSMPVQIMQACDPLGSLVQTQAGGVCNGTGNVRAGKGSRLMVNKLI